MGSDDLTRLEAQARRAYHAGRHAEAERACRAMLKRDRLHPEAVYLLGALALDAGRHEEAILHFHHVVTLAPRQAAYHNALGEAYRLVGAVDDATSCYRAAIGLDPNFASAHHALGLVLLDQGKRDEAIACFRRAIVVQPAHARAHLNLGRALQLQGDDDGAAASFEEALRLDPAYAIAWNNLGAAHQLRRRHAEAVDCFRQALRHQPDYPEAHFNLGNSQYLCGDPREAEQSFRAALRLRPAYPRAWVQLGQVLEAQLRQQEAVSCYREAIRIAPAEAEAHRCLGIVLHLLKEWQSAIAALEEAVRLQPDNAEHFAWLAFIRQQMCDYRDVDATLARLWADAERALAEGKPTPLIPFQALTLPWDNARLHAVAASHARSVAAQVSAWPKLDARPAPPTPRLRVGYLSGDLYDHPIGHLVHSLFRLHDRSAFEVFAYSFGPDDGSRFRREIESGCEHFRNVWAVPHAELARRIAADGVHVLVDLMGFTGIGRMATLAMRPAPVQVSFLGHLGTTGADFLDYVIGDPFVTPLDRAQHFSERLAVLPHTYLIASPPAQPAAPSPSRAQLGLPDDAFVFCCFNTTFKIDPRTFDLWMRILDRVPQSVLWLHSTSPVFEKNVRRAASERGIDPARLHFCQHRPWAEHLARQQSAALFLDTLLYGAAATAAMALSVSLPVLCCRGITFASSVAASIVTAAGGAELVCGGPEEYVDRAVHLAQHPAELRAIRHRLIAARDDSPLFDTPRFVRNIERAYLSMWQTHHDGRPPESFAVRE